LEWKGLAVTSGGRWGSGDGAPPTARPHGHTRARYELHHSEVDLLMKKREVKKDSIHPSHVAPQLWQGVTHGSNGGISQEALTIARFARSKGGGDSGQCAEASDGGDWAMP
jgi:hypothetical protein